MLQRAESGIDIVVKLIMLVIFLFLAWLMISSIYNAILTPDDQDLRHLADRIQLMGSGETKHYAKSLYVVTGDKDEALVAFAPGQTITVKIGNDQFSYENPCKNPSTACLCEVKLDGTQPRGRDCETLSPQILEGIEYLRLNEYDPTKPLPDKLYTSVKPPIEADEAYPPLRDASSYHPVFIPYNAVFASDDPENLGESNQRFKSERQLLLYLEYFKGYRDTPSKFLLTPYDPNNFDNELNEYLQGRSDYLRLCRSGTDSCEFVPYDNPVPFTSQMCEAVGGGRCVIREAPTCLPGAIDSTCACGGLAYPRGVCVDVGGISQRWYGPYSPEVDCEEIRTENRCEAYCTDGECTNRAKRHACLTDYCDLGDDKTVSCEPIKVTDYFGGGGSVQAERCQDIESSSTYIAEMTETLIAQGPGYHYMMVPIKPGTGSIIGFPSNYKTDNEFNLVLCDDGDEERCESLISQSLLGGRQSSLTAANLRHENTGDSRATYGYKPTGCNEYGCICNGPTEGFIDFKTSPTIPNGYNFVEAGNFESCASFGNQYTLVFGEDPRSYLRYRGSRGFPIESFKNHNGLFIDTTDFDHIFVGTGIPLRNAILVAIQVVVPQGAPAEPTIVHIAPYTENTVAVAHTMGCRASRNCPPLPGEAPIR